MSKELEILNSVLDEPKGKRNDSLTWVDSELCLEAMRRFAKQQANEFKIWSDKFYVESGCDADVVYYSRISSEDEKKYNTMELYNLFIEHQKQQL